MYKNTLAAKILFNGTTATGVSALTQGTYGTPSVNFTLTARKEVILSAGAFQSPQLLMVSGIGNCTELAGFNISCRVSLPGVGKGLWVSLSITLAFGDCLRLLLTRTPFCRTIRSSARSTLFT